jgi:hypothetical protein
MPFSLLPFRGRDPSGPPDIDPYSQTDSAAEFERFRSQIDAAEYGRLPPDRVKLMIRYAKRILPELPELPKARMLKIRTQAGNEVCMLCNTQVAIGHGIRREYFTPSPRSKG